MNKIYAICIASVSYTLTIERFIIVIVGLNNLIIKLNILAELANLTNIFSQKKTDMLLSFNKNVHMINLNDNESFFGFLYNLSINKLEIIRIYLNIYLAKE
jgi:hypothetical protein